MKKETTAPYAVTSGAILDLYVAQATELIAENDELALEEVQINDVAGGYKLAWEEQPSGAWWLQFGYSDAEANCRFGVCARVDRGGRLWLGDLGVAASVEI